MDRERLSGADTRHTQQQGIGENAELKVREEAFSGVLSRVAERDVRVRGQFLIAQIPV